MSHTTAFPSMTKKMFHGRTSLPPPPPINWASSQISPQSASKLKSEIVAEPSISYNAPSNFVVLCHGRIKLPTPVPTDKKLRVKAMKNCAKMLQDVEGRFVLLSFGVDRIRIYSKSDPSNILYQLPFAQIDMLRLSHKDRTFFYFTVDTTTTDVFKDDDQLNNNDVATTIDEKKPVAIEEETFSICYVFHAINHISATRIHSQLKSIVERRDRERAKSECVMSNTISSTSNVSLLGHEETAMKSDMSFWDSLASSVLEQPPPPPPSSSASSSPTSLVVSSSDQQTDLLGSVFTSPSYPVQPSAPVFPSIPISIPGPQMSVQNPFATHDSMAHQFIQTPARLPPPPMVPLRKSIVPPNAPHKPMRNPFEAPNVPLQPMSTYNPFDAISSTIDSSIIDSTPMASHHFGQPTPLLMPMPRASLEDSEKNCHRMSCTTPKGKEKSGQQLFDSQFNDFLSATVKSHFSTGTSSNSNLLN